MPTKKQLQEQIEYLDGYNSSLNGKIELLESDISFLNKREKEMRVSHDKICQDIRGIAKERDDLKRESSEKTVMINSLSSELSKPSIEKTVVNIASITIN